MKQHELVGPVPGSPSLRSMVAVGAQSSRGGSPSAWAAVGRCLLWVLAECTQCRRHDTTWARNGVQHMLPSGLVAGATLPGCLVMAFWGHTVLAGPCLCSGRAVNRTVAASSSAFSSCRCTRPGGSPMQPLVAKVPLPVGLATFTSAGA